MEADGFTKNDQMKCIVQKFKTLLPCKDVKTIFPSLPCNKLAFHANSGELTVVDIARDNIARRHVFPKVESFCWLTDTGDDEEEVHCPAFCVVDDSMGLQIYTIQNDSYEVVYEYKSSLIKRLLEDRDVLFTRLDILSYRGNVICLSCGSATVVSLQLRKDEPLAVLCVLSLGHLHAPVPHSQAPDTWPWRVKRDILAAYDEKSQKLFVYSIISGGLLAWLDLSEPIPDDPCLWWELSEDLDYFCVISSKLALYHLCLRTCAQARPSSLKSMNKAVSDDLSEDVINLRTVTTDTYATTTLGDPPWRNQIADLLTKSSKYDRRPWYLGSSVNTKPCIASKGKHSVTGFKGKQQGGYPADCVKESTAVREISLPEPLGEGIHNVTVSSDCVTIQAGEEDGCRLGTWNVTEGNVSVVRFSAGDFLLLSREPGHPHLLLTANSLATVGQVRGQEQLVSSVMLYGGASTADVLCHLNDWDRCAIPINTLETGLKHRQLDTVSFFLKSKENLFSSNRNKVTSPSPGGESSGNSRFSWVPSYSHEDNFAQLEPALDLLVQCVRDSVTDPQSRQFAEQLMSVTLNHLYGLQVDALLVVRDRWGAISQTPEERAEAQVLEGIVEKLMLKVGELRKCLRVLLTKSASQTRHAPSSDTQDEGDGVEDQTAQWEAMDTNDVIEAGVITNKMLQVQQYLWQRGQRQKAGHSAFIHASLERALKYLHCEQIEPAKRLLSSLGFSVTSKLWEFVLYCKDVRQREFILGELKAGSGLSPEQQSVIEFYTQLCEAYRDRSGADESTPDSAWEDRANVSGSLPEARSEGQRVGWGTANQSRSHTPTTHLLFDWLLHWDLRRRQRILVDAEDKDPLSPEAGVTNVDGDVLWEYYLSHCNRKFLNDWLEASFHGDSVPSGQTSLQGLPTLTSDVIEEIEDCPNYLKQLIADHCARYGVFNKTSLESFPEVLSQLVRVGGVMTEPHPLQDSPYLSLTHFHQAFLKYCVTENLPSLIWDYLDYYRLDPSQSLCTVDELLADDHFWLPFLANVYGLAKSPTVPSNMVKASLSNGAFVNQMSNGKMEEEFIRTHPLAAIATALYSPCGVDTVISRRKLLGKMIPNNLEKQLEKFPKLSQALFPASVTGLEKTDVTVYQLLQKSAPFCPTQLFGWQTTNELASEDSMKDLPYFSHPDLVAKYAPVVSLRYTYYLRQGRPSFAFVSFLAQEIDSGVATISKKRVSMAYRVATVIAIKHVSSEQVVSGCTAFVEMLGEDSSYLRTHAQVTNTLLQHKNTGVSGSSETRREITRKHEQDTVELMLCLLRNRRGYGRQVLSCLEDAVSESIVREKIASVSFEAAFLWNPVLLFCYHSRMAYSTCFLETCARDNQWLPFIWFSQMHQYPKEQLHGLLHLFKSRPLREHLHYVIENAQAKSLELSRQPAAGSQPQAVHRDIRSSLYTRIGLAKSKGEAREQDSSSSEEEDGHLAADEEEEASILDEEVFSVKIEAAPDDVFGVVFAAVASKCQWKSLVSHSIVLRNPLFAVLAASFPDSTRLACLTSWLVATMDEATCTEYIEQHGTVATRWSLTDLRILIDIFIQKSWTTALATGFDIFQMDSPLLPFLMFYAEFTERKQYVACKKFLEQFKDTMFAFRQTGKKSGSSPGVPDASGILGHIDWFEQVSYSAICHQLTRGGNLYETTLFLGILEQVNIAPVFSFPVPDYSRLHKLVEVALATQLDVSCEALLETGSTEYRSACEVAVARLKSSSLYDQARTFSVIAGLEHDHITVTQVTEELSEMQSGSLWKSAAARHKLWQNCLEKFRQHHVKGTVIADFFQNQVSRCELEKKEEAYLYQLSHDSLTEELEADVEDRKQDIYIRLWRCKLQAKLEQMEGLSPQVRLSEEAFDFLDTDLSTPKTPPSPQWSRQLLQYGVMPNPRGAGQGEATLTDREKRVMDNLLNELLDTGQIREACKLAAIFQHYNKNLAIILSCMRLAIGEVTVGDLDGDIQQLLTQTSPTTARTRRQSLASLAAGQMVHSQSLSSLPGYLASAVDAADPDREETVNIMEKLVDHCQDGFSCCLRIITAYKISMVLHMDYEEVVSSDDFTVLEKLLVQSHPQRFTLAKDYLRTGSLTDAAVAGFLSDAIVHSLKVFNNASDNLSTSSSDLIFHPGEGTAEFSNLVRLCHDPSVLGDRLLDAVAALAGNVSDPSQAVLSIQTELLIRAHDCHSLACNMEGISNILRAARVLTEGLTRAEEFPLMIRLLTGVGRYSEMSYIFDVLKQNHQFELLLRKGMEKEARLKVAMLDYLKRFHSTDRDSFTMVALNFTMYREIAQMLEDCAYRQLAQLRTQGLDNSSETKTSLEKVVQYFSDAADSYIKDHCMRHAQSCVKQARLVALQTQTLNAGTQLINLSPTEASMFIRHHTRFSEAYIVSDAYNRKADWAAALCANYLINGDGKYFSEFKNYVKLTPSLISETIERYEQLANKPSQSLNQVRKLLGCCKDVKVKYQLAKDLGLRDMVTQMETGDCGAYLLDVFL